MRPKNGWLTGIKAVLVAIVVALAAGEAGAKILRKSAPKTTPKGDKVEVKKPKGDKVEVKEPSKESKRDAVSKACLKLDTKAKKRACREDLL